MKCIVKDCENHKGQGDLCAPCYYIITTGSFGNTNGILKVIGLTHRYQDILPEILKGREYRHDGSDWMIMESDGSVSSIESGVILEYSEWVIKFIVSNKWELKPEEIYVWGSCDEDGESFIYCEEPIREADYWTLTSNKSLQLEDQLFPKDKPKRYRLVEDNE